MSKQPFGGQKNPPWARQNTQQQQPLANLQGGSILGNMPQQNILQYQQPQQVFAQNLGIQQSNLQQQMQAQGLSAQMNQGQIYPLMATVAYPNPRNINNQAFQTVPVAANNTTVPSTKQRVFTGTVTKIHNDFGFVDEDVFFQTTACVKGSNPIMGDRVLVEASYNPSMPFKWNATRIQVLPVNNSSNNRRENPPPPKGFSQPGKQVPPLNKYNAVPPPELAQNGANFGGKNNNNSRSNVRKTNNALRRYEKVCKEKEERHRDTEAEEAERKKRREERERERITREKEREEKEKRSPSRRRSRSPKSRRRARPVPRYMVQIPKIALDMPDADVLEVTRRYSNLYIPSDFFKTHMTWVEAFPPDVPFTLTRPCSFHVMHKDVEPISSPNDIQDPPDADYLFSAKVMLMSMPAMDEVYRKCCSLADDHDGSDDTTFVHPTRLINFLVGLRGKNETMAIGGPWSPSLDGPNPEKNPSVLIKTAIRTCKSLTGIDLSNCTQWYRFVELYYRRSVSTHKGRQVSARVETVVVFLPDVWSCLPTRLEWDSLHQGYRQQFLNRDVAVDKESDTRDGADDAVSNVNMITDDQAGVNSGEPKREPTHFSELDPKTMKVQDLRIELEARGINSKGLKSQLIARLVKAMKAEADKVDREDEEENEAMQAQETNDLVEIKSSEIEDKDRDDDKKKKTDDSKKPDDKERALLEKRYTLPEAPHIIAHPSKVAKSGKFDCTVMSLSLLLDYRPEDTKEHSFEVSLFAELFNEMLMRDFGFNIYKSLYVQPEKPKEESKKETTKPSESSKKSDDSKKSDSDRNDKRSEKSEKDDHHNDDDNDLDDDKSDGKNRSKGSKKPKMITKDPNLLLSFVYFDQTHCGYIFEKDVEELLYTLGLNLSRAQVRKLVTKVVSRNSLHYRKLTDKPKDQEQNSKSTDNTTDPKITEIIDTKSDVKRLAFGNKRFLPIFENNGQDQNVSKKRKLEDGTEEQINKDGFVMYKGGLLDIEKLMAQMARLEKARADTEIHLVETKQKNNDLLQENSKASASIRELSDKLSDYRSKLSASEKEVKELAVKSETYHTLVRTIQCTINNTMEKLSKNEERSSKHDEKSSRGKSRDKNDDRSRSKSESRNVKSEDKNHKDEIVKNNEKPNKPEVKFEDCVKSEDIESRSENKVCKIDENTNDTNTKNDTNDINDINYINDTNDINDIIDTNDKNDKFEKIDTNESSNKDDIISDIKVEISNEDNPTSDEVNLKMEVEESSEQIEKVVIKIEKVSDS